MSNSVPVEMRRRARARRSASVAAWLLVTAGAVAAGLWMWTASFSGWPLVPSLISQTLGILVTLGWVVTVVMSIRQHRLQWVAAVLPILLLVSAVTVKVDLPLKARFALSSMQFDALVASAPRPETVPANPTEAQISSMWGGFPSACPDRIGSFGIRDCAKFPGGYLFYDDIGVMSQESGFAYMPAGIPAFDLSTDSFESPTFTHVSGPWYAFQSGW